MRIVASVCAGIALVASMVAVNSWLELRKERKVNAALHQQRSEAPGSTSLPLSPPTPVAVQTTAASAAPAAEAPITRTPPSTSPAMAATLGLLQNAADRQKELLKDPEYRKIQLAQVRASIGRSFPGLAEELGLSEREADKLFDLLAENQLTRMAEGSLPAVLGGQGDQEALRAQQALFERKQEESIQAQLGSKYPQWQAYQQTRPARARVTSMSSQLAQAGKPLTEVQNRALTTALIAEQQRQTQEERSTPRPPSGNPADPGYRAQMMEESLKRAEENNRRNLEAAAPYISATQLAALREQMERQTSLTRAMLRAQMERERQ